jgi:hypothetical protein
MNSLEYMLQSITAQRARTHARTHARAVITTACVCGSKTNPVARCKRRTTQVVTTRRMWHANAMPQSLVVRH